MPPLKQKATYKVGFAQTESNNPWRLAQTASMKAEAEKLGWQLVYTDAAGSAAKQVADVNSMIAQGVDAIFLSPREEKPLIPAVMAAKKAGIPLFLIDRNVDASLAKPGVDYVTFIGSDFVLEGKQAGEWLVKATNGKATISRSRAHRLLARQRPQEGLRRRHRQHPDMHIVASQTGNFNRVEGRQTAEACCRRIPKPT
jgi:ABC-type sugar transport system substrate-binding protein